MIWKEGDVCEKLLGYILVIFVLTDAHFLMFYFIFDFFLVWFTLLIRRSPMIDLC